MIPIVQDLSPSPDPAQVAACLAPLGKLLWLDGRVSETPVSEPDHPASASPRGRLLSRYSFLAADPIDWHRWRRGDRHSPWPCQRRSDAARSCAQDEAAPDRCQLPPFQGGWAGLWGYGLLHALESVPPARFDEFRLPDVALGLYDVVIAWDHQTGACVLISQGWPETEPSARVDRARKRADRFLDRLARRGEDHVSGLARGGFERSRPAVTLEHTTPVTPPHEFGGTPVSSNFTSEAYREAVRKCVGHIRRGDLFQVNLAQRLALPWQPDLRSGGSALGAAISLHQRVRQESEAPFSAVFDLGEAIVVSASPERLVRLEESGQLEARPIKGTRPLTGDFDRDAALGSELLDSEKDRAENVMIVDLLRNDLARVAVPTSVRVASLCHLERHRYVQHLVSVVTAQIAAGRSAWDVIEAVFPGGSITGAPKIRAMELIHVLEPSVRGAYCGSLGYVSATGALDLSILIRTITLAGGWAQLPVGGGITAISDPDREYEETWTKAAGMLRALAAAPPTEI